MAAPEATAAAARAAIAASDCHRFLYGNTPTLPPPHAPLYKALSTLSLSLSALSLVFVLMRFYFI